MSPHDAPSNACRHRSPAPARLRSRDAHNRLRGGFTFAELVVSATILSILAAGMTSAVIVASHALPDEQSSTATAADAIRVTEEFTGDLMYATAITEVQAASITFSVADRGHGSTGPETIRYAWSGTPGDPLTRQYNGGDVVAVCQSVERFSMTYSRKAGELKNPPRVLLIIGDGSKPSTNDKARRALMESWGCAVQVQDDGAGAATFAAAAAASDVVYISETTWGPTFSDKAQNISVGVVLEEGYLLSAFGIADYYHTVWETSIEVTDTRHAITSNFTTGLMDICVWDEPLMETSGDLAPGARVLAYLSESVGLMTVDVGAELLTNTPANARRVKLPWGGSPWDHFDMDELDDDGRSIMRKSIIWAAAPVIYSNVHVVLQTTDDPTSLAETEVQLLNCPEVSKP